MKKCTLLFIVSIGVVNITCSQPNNSGYSLSKESLRAKTAGLDSAINVEKILPIGTHKNLIYLAGRDTTEVLHFFVYNESTNLLALDSITVDQRRNKIIRARRSNGLILLTGYFNPGTQFEDVPVSNIGPETHPYQHLWIQTTDKEYKIDSLPYHFIDKFYDCRFSNTGRYLICNPFTSVSPAYIADEDGFVILYDLEEIKSGHFKKEKTSCENCLNTFVNNDSFIFQKEIPIGNGFDGDYHNIYKAPLKNINDTTLVAHNIELLLVSPDQKFILGTQYLYGKNCPLILDIGSGKFQYLLGRDYPVDRCFYSTQERKFAFDFDTCIIYIETPTTFPFDAKENRSKYTSTEEDKSFWKNFSSHAVR